MSKLKKQNLERIMKHYQFKLLPGSLKDKGLVWFTDFPYSTEAYTLQKAERKLLKHLEYLLDNNEPFPIPTQLRKNNADL